MKDFAEKELNIIWVSPNHVEGRFMSQTRQVSIGSKIAYFSGKKH